MPAFPNATYFGFLNETRRLFQESRDLASALAVAARQAVPRIADFCVVQQLDAAGAVLEAAAVHLVQEFDDKPDSIQARTFAGPDAARSFAAWALGVELASQLSFPLRFHGRIHGALLLGNLGFGGFAPDQANLAEEFARCAAMGLQRFWREEAYAPASVDVVTQMQERLALLQCILDSLPVSVVAVEAGGIPKFMNLEAARNLGLEGTATGGSCTLATLLEGCDLMTDKGKPVKPADLPVVRALETGEPVRSVLIHRDRQTGQQRWWELHALPHRNESDRVDLAVLWARDLTREKALETKLRRALQDSRTSRELLQVAFDSLEDRIGILDAEGRIVYANESLARFLGPEVLLSRMRDPNKGFPDRLECTDPEGSPVAWETSPLARALRGEPAPPALLHFRDQVTGVAQWVESRAVAIRDVRGGLALVVDMARVVSATQKELRIQGRPESDQRFETLGRLVGGIAHEFNNLFTSIGGFAELAGKAAERVPDAYSYFKEIQRAEQRGALLIRQLLAFGRRQMLHPTIVRLSALVEGLADVLERIAGDRVKQNVELCADPDLVRVDPERFKQCLLHLVYNAKEAIPAEGVIRISTTVREVMRTEASVEGRVSPGRYAVLEVGDTGVGIAPWDRQRIFEPFYSTKGKAKCNGMGLSEVLGFVYQSQGFIQLESEPGKGATFRLLFPSVPG